MKIGTGIDALAVAAHPDDIEFTCAGTLISMAEKGYQTGIVDLTKGELSSQGDLETRAKETAAASTLMGLSIRENLNFPDGQIGIESEQLSVLEQTKRVVAMLRRLRPEILIVPYELERHPDHVAASQLLDRAIFLAGVVKFDVDTTDGPFSPHQVLYFQMRFELPPSIVVDITPVLDKKLAALRAYSSQVTRPTGKEAGFATLLSSPLSAAHFEIRDRYFGSLIGTYAAEPFFTKNAIRVNDPIAHFRENPNASALTFPRK